MDTNVIISAFLFGGYLRGIKAAFMNGQLTPVLSSATISELARVLAYRKFKLTSSEQQVFLNGLLMKAEVFPDPTVDPAFANLCGDRDDHIFIALAQHANVALVSGDSDLAPLRATGLIKVISPSDLVRMLA